MAWNPSDKAWLIANYPTKGLVASSLFLKKPIASIRSQANRWGLRIDRSSDHFKEWQERAAKSKIGKLHSEESKQKQSIQMRRCHAEGRINFSTERRSEATRIAWTTHPHPKGFKGHTRNEEERKDIAKRFKKLWDDPISLFNSPEHRQTLSDRMSKMQAENPPSNPYSRCAGGVRKDIGPMYFRSKWEANFARYLNWMKERGEIYDWKYEPTTFWFERIMRGVRSYKPDFLVKDFAEDEGRYIEVKGWMDAKSKTKLKRMKKYHPKVPIEVFGQKEYKQLQQLGRTIPGWEP